MNEGINKNEDSRYFRLTSFYLAVFLFTKDMELVNISRLNPRRSEFVFRDTPEREQLVKNFNFSPPDSQEMMVDARKLIMAIKLLKEKLYQGGI